MMECQVTSFRQAASSFPYDGDWAVIIAILLVKGVVHFSIE